MRFLITCGLFLASGPALGQQVARYQAVINNLGATLPGGATSAETGMTGLASFTLSEPISGSPTLAYDIVLSGIDFLGTDGDPTNDITALHFHDTTGVNHSAGTPHVLNVFGFPSVDDADAVVDGSAARVTGLWDDGDLTDPALGHATNPIANSDTLTSSLEALKAGALFVMLHTTSPDALPGTPGITIGGRIVEVPEPSAALLIVAAALGSAARR